MDNQDIYQVIVEYRYGGVPAWRSTMCDAGIGRATYATMAGLMDLRDGEDAIKAVYLLRHGVVVGQACRDEE